MSTNKLDLNIKYQNLINLSVTGIEQMFDTESNLFCYRVRRNGSGIIKEGLSLRYTLISLLGLFKIEAQGIRTPFKMGHLIHSLVNNSDKIENIGDLGLLLWLCALASPEKVIQLYSKINNRRVLECFKDARQGRTMELAWFLTGLVYTSQALQENWPDLSCLIGRTYKALRANYFRHGIFSHQSLNNLTGKLRGRIASFADQVYPIYALSKYAKVYKDEDALTMAVECGKTICNYQGELGQWWWHYDAFSGRLLGKYPVYAVHQDAMAPMALFALDDASGQDFRSSAYKGIEWVTGSNELNHDLRDSSRKVIWRSFYRKQFSMYYDDVSSLLGFRNGEKKYKDLMIKFECRPYHLGWILYALAGHKII